MRNYKHMIYTFEQVETWSGEELTCANVVDKVKKLSSALTKRGLQRQQVVALCLQNTNYYPVVMLAVNSCNAIVTPCNPNYTECEFIILLFSIWKAKLRQKSSLIIIEWRTRKSEKNVC